MLCKLMPKRTIRVVCCVYCTKVQAHIHVRCRSRCRGLLAQWCY
jgi:hypothetical protein